MFKPHLEWILCQIMFSTTACIALATVYCLLLFILCFYLKCFVFFSPRKKSKNKTSEQFHENSLKVFIFLFGGIHTFRLRFYWIIGEPLFFFFQFIYEYLMFLFARSVFMNFIIYNIVNEPSPHPKVRTTNDRYQFYWLISNRLDSQRHRFSFNSIVQFNSGWNTFHQKRIQTHTLTLFCDHILNSNSNGVLRFVNINIV